MRNPFDSNAWSSPSWSDTLSRSWARVPATAGVVVSTALLAGLTYAVWRAVRNTHASRQGAKPASAGEEVTRWEGEGGGVPVGGSRTASEMSTSGTGGGTHPAAATGSSSAAPGGSARSAGLQGASLAGGAPGGLPH